MKRDIVLCGFLITVFVVLTVPSIPAIHYNSAMDSYKTKLIDDIKSGDVDHLQKMLKGIDNPKIQQKLQDIDFNILKTAWEIHPLALLLSAIVFVFWMLIIGLKISIT